MEYFFTIREEKKFLEAMRKRPQMFLRAIRKRWSRDGGKFIKLIVRNQLSGQKGNKGLNRKTGEASRALNITTRRFTNDIVQKLFMRKNSPAKDYLPIHDKSHPTNELMHPGGTPYIVTKKGVRWMKKDGKYPKGVKFTKPHKIKFKARTNIIETYVKKTKPRLWKAIRQSVVEVT